MDSKIISRIYCPGLKLDRNRALAAIKAFETYFPQDKLIYTISEEGKLIELSNRDQQVLNEKGNGLSLICNGSESNYAAISAFNWINESSYITVEVPQKGFYIEKILILIAELGDILQAFFITTDGSQTAGVSSILQHNNYKPDNPYELPWLSNLTLLKIPASEMADRFGWINYWSKKIADNIGFDFEKDQHFFYQCRPTEHGWILQLTEETLNLEIPEHLIKLKEAYRKFQKVGRQDLVTVR